MSNTKKPHNELTNIDGVELDLIQEWLHAGRSQKLPQEVAQYLEYMEIVRSQLTREEDKSYIIKLLMTKPYQLTRYKASQVYMDAINFFYVDSQVKTEAWANYYAEKKERAANKIYPLIRTSKDFEAYQKALNEAAKLRLEYRSKEFNIPEDILRKPVRIYTADVEIHSSEHQKVNREELAQLIDQYDIPETSRRRIRAEASLEPAKINLDDSAAQ